MLLPLWQNLGMGVYVDWVADAENDQVMLRPEGQKPMRVPGERAVLVKAKQEHGGQMRTPQ